MRKNLVRSLVEKQINEYLKGKRKKFDLSLLGISHNLKELEGTEFKKKVWRQLLKIQYGNTVSYEYIAKAIGKPKAVRAVASAIASNPLHIFIPCHRVIPKGNRGIGQYAGGIEVKRMLLDIESKVI
jgi:methylated-DNA-[protein]-cysteine S-methyltransferase